MSNPNSAVKCGTFISQLKNCSQGCAEGPTSCYQWGFMWAWWWVKLNRLDDVIWWCVDFHSRNFMEFVSSKQFPHQLYLSLQSHLKAWADSPKDLLHDITAHVRSGEVAQTCWVMGGADMAIKQLYFQRYVYNILIICLPHISIYYLLAAVPGIVVESVGSLRFSLTPKVLAIIGGSGAGKTTLLDTALSSAFQNKNDSGLRPIKSDVSEDVLSMLSMSIFEHFWTIVWQVFLLTTVVDSE